MDAALEMLLPKPKIDVVTPEMAGPRALGRFTLREPARYEYIEARRERFGWFTDPSDGVDVVMAPDDRTRQGRRHWYVLLRHGRTGWRVDKPIACDAIETARTIAATEWAGRVGYLVAIVNGQPVVGPHLADLADPVRYLELMKAHRTGRRLAPDDDPDEDA